MAQILDNRELVSFKELLLANSIQTDALAQLLIEKGFITQDEFFTKLIQVQAEYQSK
jgi:mannitol/fructose-specific phosphotransferase system IIA component (Ntr-type)